MGADGIVILGTGLVGLSQGSKRSNRSRNITFGGQFTLSTTTWRVEARLTRTD